MFANIARRIVFAVVVCWLTQLFQPSWCSVIHVSSIGNDSNNGSTWQLAKKSVGTAISSATSGDELWVAAGTYTERITLKSGVSLYGGFEGTEADRTQRNWNTNLTLLDGSRSGSVVTSPSGITAATIIDGFTIRNGGATNGGGVYCASSSPTITNLVITANTAGSGGGIYLSSSSPTITNCSIIANTSVNGAAVYCNFSSPQIANNTIICNSANTGGALYLSSSSPKLSNNILAYNSSGIYKAVGTGTPVLKNNCVFNPSGVNYSGLSAGAGDISADPKLVSAQYGKVHIQPDSPCVNAGLNSAPGIPSADMDGQSRIQSNTVDIGADESDGTTHTFSPAVIRVSLAGSDTNDGSTWASAKRTIQEGATTASLIGGEVWVAAGTYNERIDLPAFACLYGGFTGSETNRDQRNCESNITTIDGGTGGSAVQVRTGDKITTSGMDGFTIRNGNAASGGGVYCYSSSPTIANCILTSNTAISGGGAYLCYSSPVLMNLSVIANNSTNGAGVYCYYSSPTIANAVITGNTATANGAGIYSCYSSPKVTNSLITGNTATTNGGGIYCEFGSPLISNNIVAFNSSGLYCAVGTSPTLRNNCLWSNTAYDYSGISAGVGDIAADPAFVDRAGGNYHLTPTSPCISTGWNTAPGMPPTDLDGDLRICGGIVDIGPDEVTPPAMSVCSAKDLEDSASVYFSGQIVSAAFTDFFYIEEADRSSGIRVDMPSHDLTVGRHICVDGVVATDETTGERHVDASGALGIGYEAVLPIYLSNVNIGGANRLYDPVLKKGQQGVSGGKGLNNIGLLVTTSGEVTYTGDGFFYLDDGSALNDGSGHTGVKVTAAGLSFPSTGHVTVTGISTCEKNSSGEIVRLLRPRTQSDITDH